MIFLPLSKRFLPSLREHLITGNMKSSYCHENRAYKSLLLGTAFILLYCTVRGACRIIYFMFLRVIQNQSSILNPRSQFQQSFELHFVWASSCNHCCPFLFLAYKPRQAQNPTTLTARPTRKATASPASRASTAGSTSSNEMRTRKSFEVFPVEGMLLTSWAHKASEMRKQAVESRYYNGIRRQIPFLFSPTSKGSRLDNHEGTKGKQI